MTTQTLKNWHKVKLGDVAEIESGGTPSSTKSEYWNGGDIRWATLPDLENKYLFDTQRKITPLGLKNSSAKLLPINSVIFSSRATIGEVAITKVETSTNQGSKNFICDPKKVDYEFLYYLLKSKVEEINNLASGATYKEINKTVFSSVEVEIPNIPVQKQIAQTLAVYDDLIYNNNRRVQILEQLAQAIYIEWFVNFHFPDHEKVKMTDSGTDFGKIPQEWEVTKVGDIAEFMNGYAFKPRHLGISGWSATLLVNIWNSGEGLLNQHLFKVTPKADYLYSFIFYFLANQIEKYRSHAVGATMQHLRRDVVINANVLLPNKDLLIKFENIASDILKERSILIIENQNLRQTRDLLLPKLVTGEIEVSSI
ncbi:MAG: Restriction modification system DNA specificity domain protein [Microgenomates group bacterium GW2011_GWA2_39_19]|nr:MAG: Restriction modification system DNA specificity domain protein [Microgenomates group bacterium GW2011_GWA2_39_19]